MLHGWPYSFYSQFNLKMIRYGKQKITHGAIKGICS